MPSKGRCDEQVLGILTESARATRNARSKRRLALGQPASQRLRRPRPLCRSNMRHVPHPAISSAPRRRASGCHHAARGGAQPRAASRGLRWPSAVQRCLKRTPSSGCARCCGAASRPRAAFTRRRVGRAAVVCVHRVSQRFCAARGSCQPATPPDAQRLPAPPDALCMRAGACPFGRGEEPAAQP